MTAQTFINLPVKDLDKSVEFFTALGFTFDPQFTDSNATSMIINENTFVMLLVEKFFSEFTGKPVADAKASTEVIICISQNSRKEVDEMVEKAVRAGGKAEAGPRDHGWMYQHAFADIDGHQWEVMYGDLSQLPQK